MTPVSVEVLDLAKEVGGLRPAARVGGQQTKVLALARCDAPALGAFRNDSI